LVYGGQLNRAFPFSKSSLVEHSFVLGWRLHLPFARPLRRRDGDRADRHTGQGRRLEPEGPGKKRRKKVGAETDAGQSQEGRRRRNGSQAGGGTSQDQKGDAQEEGCGVAEEDAAAAAAANAQDAVTSQPGWRLFPGDDVVSRVVDVFVGDSYIVASERDAERQNRVEIRDDAVVLDQEVEKGNADGQAANRQNSRS